MSVVSRVDTLSGLRPLKIDHPKPKDLRQVIVKIGTPINLKDYWQDYQSDRAVEPEINHSNLQAATKGSIIDNLTQAIRHTVQTNLINHIDQ